MPTENADIFTLAKFGDLEKFKDSFDIDLVNKKSSNGSGLLHYAISGNNFEIASFLLDKGIDINIWNGGKAIPNLFMISDEQGPSVLNVIYGIGDMYDNLTDFIEIMDERLPVGFIPIGDDPSGNVICLGTKEPYYEKIYFWDHEQEPEDPNDMSNMYFLENDIDAFLDNLYKDTEE